MKEILAKEGERRNSRVNVNTTVRASLPEFLRTSGNPEMSLSLTLISGAPPPPPHPFGCVGWTSLDSGREAAPGKGSQEDPIRPRFEA